MPTIHPSKRLLSVLLFVAPSAVLASAVLSQRVSHWLQSFPETVNVLVIQNPSGVTEVDVVPLPSIRARADSATGDLMDESAISVDQSSPGVLILRVDGSAALRLRVAVPPRTVVSLQSASGEITVRGISARLLAETQSGNIVLHLPPALDADFKFTTATGKVLAGVELPEAASNSSKEGKPVVHARSESGNIVLLPLSGPSAKMPAPNTGGVAPLTPAQQRIAIVRDRLAGLNLRSEPPPKSLTNWRAGMKNTSAKPNDGRVRVNSDLVLLNAYVVDPHNASVPNLTREDFAVTDNGAPQQVAIFEPVHRPLDLLILLDLSGSTHSKFDVVKKAVKKFVDTMAPEDRIAIASFESRFVLISDFTTDRKLLKKRIDDTKNRKGGTEFYRSMWNAMDLLAEVDNPRRAIVVMTDGVDNSLQPGVRSSPLVLFEELLERSRAEGISIYPVYLNTEYQMVVKEGRGDSLSYKEAREQLQALADATGTTMFKVDRFEDLSGAYDRVAAELRNLYTIGFYPTDRGKEGDWHDLGVTVQRADATVRARKGYFVR